MEVKVDLVSFKHNTIDQTALTLGGNFTIQLVSNLTGLDSVVSVGFRSFSTNK